MLKSWKKLKRGLSIIELRSEMTTVETIDTKVEYKAALKKIDELIACNPGKRTLAYDELDVIGILASPYEDIHYPIEFRTIVNGKPRSAIKDLNLF